MHTQVTRGPRKTWQHAPADSGDSGDDVWLHAPPRAWAFTPSRHLPASARNRASAGTSASFSASTSDTAKVPLFFSTAAAMAWWAQHRRPNPNPSPNPNPNPSPNPSPNPTVAPAGLPAHVARLPPVHRGVRPARRHAAARGASARRGVSLYQGGGGGLRCSGTRYTFRRWPACVAAGQAAPGVRTHALLHKYTQCWCPRDVGRRVRFQSGHLGVNFTTLLVSPLLSSSTVSRRVGTLPRGPASASGGG